MAHRLPLKKCQNFNLKIDNTPSVPSSQVRNLGVIFEANLTLEAHIKSVVKTAFYHLKNISRIRSFLSDADAERVIHSFITSRIDYCNSLYSGLPAKSVKRLQYVQNSAARVLTRTASYQHIQGVLYNLHWLPVQYRIDYKTLVLTYKAVQGLAPSYIADLVSIYTPSRSLRSADSLHLNQPSCRLKTMDQRAFSCAAPRLWNALPLFVRNAPTLSSFKKSLKTHLFKTAYNV